MTIEAKVITDSVSPEGIRLLTFATRNPRFIHSEMMTHRMLSRNASSSRAIPVERLIEDIVRDTAMPIHWGKNQKGMQAREELDEVGRSRARAVWLSSRNRAIEQAEKMIELGVHKQIVNRILEPFSHINVLITATEWNNFFALRQHQDAQPEIKMLADAMADAMETSVPRELAPGQWHLPFVTAAELVALNTDEAIRVSVARCARVSYKTHDGKRPQIEQDLALYDRLVGSVPLHASPAEHQAMPDCLVNGAWEQPELHGNFRGWVQYRKTLAGECQ